MIHRLCCDVHDISTNKQQLHEVIEHEQRLPHALVEQLHAASVYRLVLPCELGGLQADPLPHLRVVKLVSEGAGSVG